MREPYLEDFIASFKEEPQRSAIFLDFDGTLSEIAPTPEGARLYPPARSHLRRLVSRYPLFFLSGRPAEELQRLINLKPSTYIGLHGLEWRKGSEHHFFPGSSPYMETMGKAKESLTRLGLESMQEVILEDKGLILALHYRQAPFARDQVVALAQDVAATHRLAVHYGKKVIELRPPLAFDKGKALETMVRAGGYYRAIHMGDDLTDCTAFDALHRLEEENFSGLAVAVLSPESPPILVEKSDYHVDGVKGALQFLSLL